MNKYSKILFAALAVAGLTACQQEKDFVEPATNPQLPMLTAGDVTVAAAIPATIDITAYNNQEDHNIVMGKAEVKNLPEGYHLEFVGNLGREAEFSHSADFKMSLDTLGNVFVTADDLEGAYIDAIGKSAKPKQVYFRAEAFVVSNNTETPAQAQIGAPGTYFLEGTSNVTPLDLGIVIEDGYGLLGSINGWSVANAVKFDHSGADVYDDPIFDLFVNVANTDGWWWKVVPQSTIAAGDWVNAPNASFGVAVNGDDALEGALIPRTETVDPGAGCVKVPGVYKMVLDMENQAYSFVSQFDLMWAPGGANNWAHGSAAQLASEPGKGKYKGFGKFEGEFKLTDAFGWGGNNFGAGAEAGTLSTSGGNLKAPAAGFYFATAEPAALTYSLTAIQSCGLIGGFNGWGSQLALTPNADQTVWTGSVTLSDGDEFKVRFNDNWDINLGGDVRCLTVGGANIKAPAAGTYQVTLNISKLPYTLTLKK